MSYFPLRPMWRASAPAIALLGVTALVYAQTPDCQATYQQEVKAASGEHINEAKGCQGNSTCIANANKKKAAAGKKAGNSLATCNKAKNAPLKADTAQLDPREQWTHPSKTLSIWTDQHGKQWEFPNSVTVSGNKYALDKSSVRLYEPYGVPVTATAGYRDPNNIAAEPQRFNGRRVP